MEVWKSLYRNSTRTKLFNFQFFSKRFLPNLNFFYNFGQIYWNSTGLGVYFFPFPTKQLSSGLSALLRFLFYDVFKKNTKIPISFLDSRLLFIFFKTCIISAHFLFIFIFIFVFWKTTSFLVIPFLRTLKFDKDLERS